MTEEELLKTVGMEWFICGEEMFTVLCNTYHDFDCLTCLNNETRLRMFKTRCSLHVANNIFTPFYQNNRFKAEAVVY